ncbi:MAG: nicotinate-nucleotide--dimethylbenzimidazole phosphoribosyltransferase [Bryobacteraceae bacterium]
MTNDNLAGRVQERLNSLTKPPGSLGLLEDLAFRFALIRGEAMPSASRKAMYVFCADHGVTEEGVSPYPPEVTQQMVRNFLQGGAAINVLCRQFDITPIVVDAGVIGEPVPGVLDRKIAQGTSNFAHFPAMTRNQVERALAAGRELAEDAATFYDVVGLGEMGIGNTTAAAALLSAFTGRDPAETAGPGAGLDERGIAHKAAIIRRALELHQPDLSDPVEVLSMLGGFEIAAMAGFLMAASEIRLPVVIDGFISSTAALAARAIHSGALETAIFSHRSQERGHDYLLHVLGAEPYFDFRMRLGEGTGAAIMIAVIESSVRLYREMATFGEAGVSKS